MAAKKQYGLIRPKAKPQVLSKPSVFDEGSSDEEDEDSRKKHVSAKLRKEGIKKLEAKTTRNMLTEALYEDPTVFDYDGVYEQMQAKKLESKLLGKQDKKSKYIANLKRTAEVRKIEQELAYERKVQKERETEGEAFSDKDSFVTLSYMKKLEERAAIEERLKREEEIEKLNDVTKESDLSRFYRNMLERKTTGKPTSASIIEKEEQMREAVEKQEKEERKSESNTAQDDEDDQTLDKADIEIEESRDSGNEESGNEESKSDEQTNKEVSIEEKTDATDTILPVPPTVPEAPPQETTEERRKRIFAKRTNEEAALSAKERYLARKKAKMSQPSVAIEDD